MSRGPAAGGPGSLGLRRGRRRRRGGRGRHRGRRGRRRLRARLGAPTPSSPCWTPGRAKPAVGRLGRGGRRRRWRPRRRPAVLDLLGVGAGRHACWSTAARAASGLGRRAGRGQPRAPRSSPAPARRNQGYLRRDRRHPGALRRRAWPTGSAPSRRRVSTPSSTWPARPTRPTWCPLAPTRRRWSPSPTSSGRHGHPGDDGPAADPAAALAEAARLLESNRLVVKVQTFPLERAREAAEISESGHVRGKLVLLP